MDALAHIDDLAGFVSASPSSFHAAATVAARLTEAGYVRLDETEDWADAVVPGARLVVVRGGSVIALALPGDVHAGTPYRIVGAHTDSPGFKLKPRPALTSHGWRQANVEVYGGPVIPSWFDRELELAGRLVHRDGTEHLVRTGALLRIPHVAIHLGRNVNSSFGPDAQRDLLPLFGVGDGPDILAHLAGLAGLEASEVAGFDLITVDAAAPARFGAGGSLFASARLDNLSSVHAGLAALLAAPVGPAIAVLAAFDHEEVGSDSRTGAGGPMLADVLERVTYALGGDRGDLARVIAGSWCLSADASHSIHPNRPEFHDPTNRPLAGGGPLLKINAIQRYATDGVGAALWARTCEAAGVPWQEYVTVNTIPCGSTIGPIIATRLGMPTVDAGVALLSMHSAREMCHVDDPARLAAAATVFLSGLP